MSLVAHGFPEGMVVSAYPREALPPDGTTPAGAALATATVTSGALDFVGLAAGRRYLAYANGKQVSFFVQPANLRDSLPDRRRIEQLETDEQLVAPPEPPPPPPEPINVRVADGVFSGLVGDGIADDTAAWDHKRALARAAGAPLYFPKGTYKRTSSEGQQLGDLTFGDGYKQSILTFTSAAGFLAAVDTAFTDHVQITNLALVGDGVTSTIGLQMKSCRDWYVANVELTGWTDTNVQIYGQRTVAGALNPGDSTYNHFEHCRFLGGTDAVRLTGTTGTARLDGGTANMNTFVSCRFASASRYGCWVNQGSANAFIRCSVVANGSDGWRIGWFGNSIGAGCVSENNGGFGVKFTTDSECHDNTYFGLHDGGSNVSGLVDDPNVENSGMASRRGLRLMRNAGGTGSMTSDTIYNSTDGILRWKDKDSNVGIVRTRKGSVPTVASAAALTLDAAARVQKVSGTTTITSIDVTGNTERVVTLIFTSSAQMTDGGNLKLSANFTGAADRAITLVCDGTNWFETARSAN